MALYVAVVPDTKKDYNEIFIDFLSNAPTDLQIIRTKLRMDEAQE